MRCQCKQINTAACSYCSQVAQPAAQRNDAHSQPSASPSRVVIVAALLEFALTRPPASISGSSPPGSRHMLPSHSLQWTFAYLNEGRGQCKKPAALRLISSQHRHTPTLVHIPHLPKFRPLEFELWFLIILTFCQALTVKLWGEPHFHDHVPNHDS